MSGPINRLVVVVVVLEVRRVAVDERVAVFVEAVEDPEPREPPEAVRPALVEHPRLVQRQPRVRHARAVPAWSGVVGESE